MSKLFFGFLSFILVAFLSSSTPVYADNCSVETDPNPVVITDDNRDSLPVGYTITYKIRVASQGTYKAVLSSMPYVGFEPLTPNSSNYLVDRNGQFPIHTVEGADIAPLVNTFRIGQHSIELTREGVSGTYCTTYYSIVRTQETSQVTCNILGPVNPASDDVDIRYSGSVSPAGRYRFFLQGPSTNIPSSEFTGGGDIGEQNLGRLNPGQYGVKLQKIISRQADGQPIDSYEDVSSCSIRSLIVAAGITPTLTPVPVGGGTPLPPGGGGTPGPTVGAGGEFCDAARTQVRTALGCVPTQPKPFIEGTMKFIAGAAGGIALLLIIGGAFQMMTSQGNPESLKKGQEQLTSALIGLLFIIFSVLLLQIIGADILKIPGFER